METILPSKYIRNEYILMSNKYKPKYTISYIDVSKAYTWYVDNFEKGINETFRNRKTTAFKWLVDYILVKYFLCNIGISNIDTIHKDMANDFISFIMNNHIPYDPHTIEYSINSFIDSGRVTEFISIIAEAFRIYNMCITEPGYTILPIDWSQYDMDILKSSKGDYVNYKDMYKHDIRLELTAIKYYTNDIKSHIDINNILKSISSSLAYDIERPEYD